MAHELVLTNEHVVMEALRDLAQGVDAICGGLCSCATCHVHIADAWLGRVGPPGQDEVALLAFLPDYDEKRSRLSCQIAASPDIDGLELTIVADR